ncbi:hypothetical protein C8R43DRAFT_1109650 [Mycena crocata]|nr:hypothetical protein C8R43DRAFT_1109650 [Mycena crocata]
MQGNPGEDGINSSWWEQRARGAEEIGGQCNPCCCVTIRGALLADFQQRSACHFDNVKIQHGTVSSEALSTALEPVHRHVTLGSRRVYGFNHSSSAQQQPNGAAAAAPVTGAVLSRKLSCKRLQAWSAPPDFWLNF